MTVIGWLMNGLSPAAGWIDTPVLGRLPPEDVAEKLRQLGEVGDADALERSAGAVTKAAFGPWWPFNDRPWQYVGHAFGFAAGAVGGGPLDIADAGQIAPQESLRGARVK